MRALLVGRFQPPHRGHLQAIRKAARKFERVFVGVGSAQYSHHAENPFTLGERFDMLRAALDDLTNVHLFPVPDIHRHAEWVAHVEGLLPRFDVVLTRNPVTRRLFKAAGYRVEDVALWKPDECSGKRIRKRWLLGDDAADLIPPPVVKVLRQIGGPERVRTIREVKLAEKRGRRH